MSSRRLSRLRPWACLAIILAGSGFSEAQVTQTSDQVLVGSMPPGTYSSFLGLPAPTFANEKFCSLVLLASDTTVWAYVPTAAERVGDFSAFAGQLLDPSTNQPFPGNVIPQSLIPGVFAWRLAPAGPAPGEPCIPFPTSSGISFTTANYITGRGSGDALFTLPNIGITLNYVLGSTPSSATFTVDSFSKNPLPVSFQVLSGSGPASQPPKLVFQASPGATTPATVTVTVSPSQALAPGLYVLPVKIIPINTIGGTANLDIAVTVSAPPSYITTDVTLVSFPSYDVTDTTNLPPAQVVNITSLGIASQFAIARQSISPPGVLWFTVTPLSGVGPQALSVALDPSVINKIGRGQFTGYFDIFASGPSGTPGGRAAGRREASGTPPNNPVRVIVTATVVPNPDFTISVSMLNFIYALGGPTPAPASFSLDPVPNPLGTTGSLSFSPNVVFTNPQDPNWLTVSPNAHGLPGTYSVALAPNLLGSVPAGDHTAYVTMNSATGSDGEDPPNSNTANRVLVDLNVSAVASSSTQTLILAHIADGVGWQTQIVLVNTDTTTAAPITLRFWPGQNTSPLAVPVLTTGPLNNFTLTDTIPAGGSRTYYTQGLTGGQLWQGWGELTAPQSVGGTAVFRNTISQDQANEGAVPLKPADGSRFVLPFDFTAPDATHSFGTSMALVNVDHAQAANISVTAYGVDGSVIAIPANSTFRLDPQTHQAFLLTDRFSSIANQRGILVFTTSGGQMAGLGLRFSSRQAFTSVQTLNGAAAGTTKRIAHIADGQLWQTTIVIVNMDSIPASLTMRFNRSQLTPNASLALQQPGLVGSIYGTQTPIPVNGSLWISTQGTSSALWEGWASISSNANIDGFAIFQNQFSDIADSEGAVPFSSPGGTRFLMPFDNTNGFVTAMAMVSPGTGPAQITGTFRFPDGTTDTPGANMLQLTGHTAFGLLDALPFNAGGAGVADFSANSEIFGIGLLFNPRHSFTSLPILPR